MSRNFKSPYADERQSKLYLKFSENSFLGNPQNLDRFFLWNTFFRRNLHRFAIDYLGLKLHLFQVITLFLMGISRFVTIVAGRGTSKSFIIALYCCCQCILRPYSKMLVASATKGQAKLIVSEKIRNELMSMSPNLRREILKIKDNQNEVIVYFKNHSTITVVPASENGRGYRSNYIIREEFRQIDKKIDDSILSPTKIIRQTPYIIDDFYSKIEDAREEPVDIYISSSWLDNGHWMWNIVDSTAQDMFNGKDFCLLAFDESVTLKHGIKTMEMLASEKKKQDPLTWRIEFLNERVKENEHTFFPYSLFKQNQVCKQPWFPRTSLDVRSNKKNPYDIPRQKGEVRVVSCDMAFITNTENDNSVFTCARLLPETDKNGTLKYKMIVCYMVAVQGGDTQRQAIQIRQLYEDFNADYIVLDTRNAGIAVLDALSKVLYDEDRGKEYSPLACMNNDSLALRNRNENATPCIYAINATQKLNGEIAMLFRRMLSEKRIQLLVSLQEAQENILSKNKDYMISDDADVQIFYERPFLETQALIAESCALVYEKKEQTGAIIVKEQRSKRKDRYTSCSYLAYFCQELEQDILTNSTEYEFHTFIN